MPGDDNLRGGCAWRLLPHEFPKWETVYHYMRAWRKAGLWEHIHGALRKRARIRAGREAEPSACIVVRVAADSSTEAYVEAGELRFVDSNKVTVRLKKHKRVRFAASVQR